MVNNNVVFDCHKLSEVILFGIKIQNLVEMVKNVAKKDQNNGFNSSDCVTG